MSIVKQLARSIRQYKKDAILAPVFVVGEVALEVIIPLIMADIIDYGINVGDMNYVIKSGIILIILCLLSLFLGAMSGKFAAGFRRHSRNFCQHAGDQRNVFREKKRRHKSGLFSDGSSD